MFFCYTCVVRARNHDFGKDADVRLFDREKSSNFPDDLPYLQDATEELGEGNDKRFHKNSMLCRMCPQCVGCGK